jgi:hypothetical protein
MLVSRKKREKIWEMAVQLYFSVCVGGGVHCRPPRLPL